MEKGHRLPSSKRHLSQQSFNEPVLNRNLIISLSFWPNSEISEITSVKKEDVISTLQYLNLINYYKVRTALFTLICFKMDIFQTLNLFCVELKQAVLKKCLSLNDC